MPRHRLKRKGFTAVFSSQSGTTIVEILLALSIAGAVIAAGFAAVNRSTQSVQQSQERSEAVKVAESQIEQVRSLFSSDEDTDVEQITGSDSGSFCINQLGEVEEFGLAFSLVDSSAEQANIIENLNDAFPSECFYDDRYGMHLEYLQEENRLITTVRWQRIGGGVDQVELVYGLYEIIDD